MWSDNRNHLLDDLLRDSLMTGAKYGVYDLEWIINALAIDQTDLLALVRIAELHERLGEETPAAEAPARAVEHRHLGEHAPRIVHSRTAILIMSDGYDTGEPQQLSDALAQLREVDVIAHVIRVFDDPSVPHAAASTPGPAPRSSRTSSPVPAARAPSETTRGTPSCREA